MSAHEIAKAAADATVPEDMDNVTHREWERLWFVARDAALFALEEIQRRDLALGEAEMELFNAATCPCTTAERYVASCPKHGFPEVEAAPELHYRPPSLMSFLEATLVGGILYDHWASQSGKRPPLRRDDSAWSDLARTAFEGLRRIRTAPVDRSGEAGETREAGLDAKHESAVPAKQEGAQPPSEEPNP